MTESAPSAPTDLDETLTLAEILKGLGNPVRLRLLQLLRNPTPLADIRVKPERKEGGKAAERSMSKVGVRAHLMQLLELGVVRPMPLVRDGRTLDHYQVNHAQLFALTEELRTLVDVRGSVEVLDGTQPLEQTAAAPLVQGPHFVLIHGVRAGRRIVLFPRPDGKSWSIGRHPDSDVCLDYDPFLSLRNTEIESTRSGHRIRDMPDSRNGTQLNWKDLESDWNPLRDGDVVGAGRSLLLFRSTGR